MLIPRALDDPDGAYELVRSDEIRCIPLRRRVVVPATHLAESFGVDRERVWNTLGQVPHQDASPD